MRRLPPPLGAALGLAVLHSSWHAGFTVDDAGIFFSYARSLAEGVGLGVLDPGGARVEGYSSLLWTLLLALATAVGLPVVAAAKVLGASSLAGSCWLLHSILDRLVRRKALLWAALLLPLSACAALWSISGLESGFFLFLLLASCRLLMDEEENPAPRRVGSSVTLLAACLTRPDAFAFVAAAFAAKVLGAALAADDRPKRAGHLAAWTAILALSGGLYLAWHVRFFGFVFPNTVYVKAATPSIPDLVRQVADLGSPGWTYVRGWLAERGGILLVPAAAAGAVAAMARRSFVVPAFAAVSLLLPLYRSDWMVEHRFLVPFVPFAVALSAAGLDTLLDHASRPRTRAALSVSAILLAAVYVAANVRASLERRASGYSLAVTMDEVRALYGPMFAAPVSELGLSRPLVAIPDLGATTYQLRLHVLDVGGLADANLAHARSVPEIEAYLFDERRPDLLHVHGPYMLPTRFRSFRRDYEVLSENAIHLEAVRRDLFVDRIAGPAFAPLDGPIGVSGFFGPEAAEPGGTVLFDLFLARNDGGRMDAAPPEAGLLLRVSREDGRLLSERPLSCGPSFLPPARWGAGERVRQQVAVPAGDEPGRLRVDILVRMPRTGALVPGASRSVVVGREAAAELARVRLGEARRLSAEGQATRMHRLLDVARAAAPGAARWDAEQSACDVLAARGIADQAREHLDRGRWKAAIDVLREADRVGGARSGSAELRGLAASLRARGTSEPDPTRRYLLFRASWFADPLAASTLRGLIEARRVLFSSRPTPP